MKFWHHLNQDKPTFTLGLRQQKSDIPEIESMSCQQKEISFILFVSIQTIVLKKMIKTKVFHNDVQSCD